MIPSFSRSRLTRAAAAAAILTVLGAFLALVVPNRASVHRTPSGLPSAPSAHGLGPATMSPIGQAPLAPKNAGTCLACPNYDFPGLNVGCYTPTTAWQSQAASITSSSDCNWYCVNVDSGFEYEFSTCPAPGSPAASDPGFFTIISASDPGTCAGIPLSGTLCAAPHQQSDVTFFAPFTGQVRVNVRGQGLGTGNYTLAFRKICPPTSSCAAPDAVLPVPSTVCQYRDGTADDCQTDRYYSVQLIAAHTYTFTTCGTTCFGAHANFDSTVELSKGGLSLATSTNACGDDGEVVYNTDPVTGDGTYCVHVHFDAPGTGNDFRLGYFVNCQFPAGVTITPSTSGTTSPDCSHDQLFDVATLGTGPFTYDWTITAPAGASANASSGSVNDPNNTTTFTSHLQGAGVYSVTVMVTNTCGSASTTINFTLEDRLGPVLTPIAQAGPCPVPFTHRSTRRAGDDSHTAGSLGTRRQAPGVGGVPATLREGGADRWNPPFDISRDEMEAMLLSNVDTEVTRAAIARKLSVLPSSVHIVDSRDPAYFRSATAPALGCPTPCTTGVMQGMQPIGFQFYDVYLSCGDGSFTARTGADNAITISSGTNQNVIYGGQFGSPGTSDVTFHVFDTGLDDINPPGGSACSFTPSASPSEPHSAGVEEEWTRTPTAGMNLTYREEIVAFGSNDSDSGVRLTLGIHNMPTSTRSATVGVRWQIDYQNSGDDGPWYAQVHCGPPTTVDNETHLEHEFTPAEIAAEDFYRIQNNTGSPIFGNFTSATSIAGFPDTNAPDRLIYGRWPSMVGSAWGYTATEGAESDFDSAVLYYYGYTPATAFDLNPGESFTRSVIIFSARNGDCGERLPGSCGPASVTICPGTCAVVGATATDNCGSATVTLVSSTPGAPALPTNPATVEFDTAGTYVYTWQAVDNSGNQVTCTSTVIVVDNGSCNQPPVCNAGGPYGSGCRTADINMATVGDPDDDPIDYNWVSDNPAVTISPASGSLPGGVGARSIPPAVATLDASVNPCGVTAHLTLSVSDRRGGTAQSVGTVIFSDTDPPTLAAPPDITVECDAVPAPATVTALDTCDPNPTVAFGETRLPGDCPGRYTLTRTWTATDHCLNAASSSQTVHVVDTTAPTVTPGSISTSCLWPPNHWYVCFNLDSSSLGVTDNCSSPIALRLNGCTSDQPDDAPDGGLYGWNGDGNTVDDCVVDPAGTGFCVRAERCGTGPTAMDGRHYAVNVVAVDACGNVSNNIAVASVWVPHDQRGHEGDGCLDTTHVGCRELPCARP